MTERPLADPVVLALFWLAGHLAKHSSIAIDFDWLFKLPHPLSPWGTRSPDDSLISGGSFLRAFELRQVRTVDLDMGYHERMHPSVFEQDISSWPKQLQDAVHEARKNSKKVDELLDVEKELRDRWTNYQASVELTPALSNLNISLRRIVSSAINVVL